MRANTHPAYDPVPTEEVDGGKWRLLAACAGENGDLWFPEKGAGVVAAARKVCAGCEVNAECLDYAMRNHIQHGLWGGLTPRQRRAYRRTNASSLRDVPRATPQALLASTGTEPADKPPRAVQTSKTQPDWPTGHPLHPDSR